MTTDSPIIRVARPADAAGIARVEVDAWRDAYSTLLPKAYLVHRLDRRIAAERWRRRIAAAADVLVAEARGRVVGYVTWGGARLAGGMPTSQIYELYVSTGERDRGIGRGLCAAVAKRLLGSGKTQMFVEVLERNPSRYFYEALGARLAARTVAPFAGRRLPAVLYVWDDLKALTAAAVD